MANLIYSTDVITPSSVLSHSDAAGYAKENASYYLYPHRKWMASSSGADTWVGYDLGSARTIAAVMVDNINCTKVYIDCDSAATFDSDSGNPAYISAEQSVARDENTRRYKHFFALTQTYRYVRVRASSGGVMYGGTQFSVGSLVVLDSYVTLTNNFGFPVEITPTFTALSAGSGEPVQIGVRHVDLALTPTNYQSTSGVNAEFVAWMYYGETQPFVVYLNGSDTSETYICHRVGRVGQRRIGPGVYTYSPINLREVGGLT